MDVISAAQLPEVRTRLLGELTGARPGSPAFDIYVIHAAAGAQVPADPRVADPYAQAALLVAGERARLANAALYWVSPHMTALTLAAAPGMPPFRPTAADLPARFGLIYFAASLHDFTEVAPVDRVLYSDGSAREFSADPHAYQVRAASWGPYDMCGAWAAAGGTWFSFYTGARREEIAAQAVAAGRDPDRVLARMTPLSVDNECAVSASYHLAGPDPMAALAAPDSGTTAYWVHLVLAAFRLMATSRITQTGVQPMVRPTRRRAARAGVIRPDEPVRLIDIAAGSQGLRRGGDDSEQTRAYGRVRWVVEGHWRNQWYPATAAHRPRYIDSYVKGPQGAPLQTKDKVHVWRDPAEQPGATS